MKEEGEIETVDITPDTSLLPKMGRSGYSISQSIAEFIDNSIDAKVDNQIMNIYVNINKEIIEVIDNGSGMKKEELINGLKLANSEKRNQLGEFGLGMKTASTSLGDKFEIFTTTKSDNSMFYTMFDNEEWGKQDSWNMKINTINKNFPHGTIVKISKLRVNPGKRIAIIRSDLGQRFAPYINNEKINIFVNNKKCRGNQFDIIEDTKCSISIKLKNGMIKGWCGLLKKGSQRYLYGFNTFRYGRMITIYDKIGFTPHPTVARIVGELHIDHVPVTSNKREWITESEEYIEVVEALENELRDLVSLAKKKSSQEKIGKNVREKLEIWKEGINNALNEDIIKMYDKPEVDIYKLEKNRKGEDQEIIERRNSTMNSSITSDNHLINKNSVPNKKQMKKGNFIKIRGKKFEYYHDFINLGEGASWKEYNVDDNTKVVQIYTNLDYPTIDSTNDLAFFAYLNIIDSIAEIIVTLNLESLEKYDEVKDALLRSSSKYVSNRGKK